MRLALCTICPDARQQRWLDIVWPDWEAFARRHAMPLRVVEEPPRPEHYYWSKYFLFDLPEFRAFDALLVLDNDVVISDHAPSPAEGWSGERVRMADERLQFPHSNRFDGYFDREYALPLEPGEVPWVLNGGVILYHRDRVPLFRDCYEKWLAWREEYPRQRPELVSKFRMQNDQPHVALALQRAGLAELLDPRFNRLWWSWWENGGRRRELPFKLYSKGVQILGRALPRSLVRWLARPGIRWWEEALRENYFMHVAGSKSPISLYALGTR